VSKVFVVDTYKRVLDPIHPGYARRLLKQGRAAIFRRFPLTIILKVEIPDPVVQPLRIKLDPGSRTTGLALVNETTGEVVFAAELTHRGHQIKERLDQRRAVRRNRRARKTRYRQPRFKNRKNKKKGWQSPSLESRMANILTWVARLTRSCPVTAISLELVKFDLQRMENPEISGIEYQQGMLLGYEIRQYLLEKWNRQCAYCRKQDVPLQVEHIQPRAKGGTDRISNLTLACEKCNLKKGTQDITVFLKKKPELLKRIQAQAKAPLKDATAVNSTRWALFERLKATGLPIECGSGGLTKYNRTTRNLPKEHWIDAACIGMSTPEQLQIKQVIPLVISAQGHGNRQMCNVSKIGFPCSKPKGAKHVRGFQTGDITKAIVITGKKQGTYVGRVLVRSTGSFDLRTKQGRIAGLNVRFFTQIHRCDGYSYQKGCGHSSPA
jgi:5-methylcytosine-specific restriction endonuclease McrA